MDFVTALRIPVWEGMRKIEIEIAVVILVAVVVSFVSNKILAVHTLKVIDGLIDDLINETKKFIDDAKKYIREGEEKWKK